MRSRVLRSLVFSCSLLLAMPQGWCCMFAFPCHEAKATTGTQDKSGGAGESCPCCPQKSASTTPTDKPTPADKPSAPTNSICSCSDRHATVPTTSSVEKMDDGFVLILPPVTVAAQGVGHRMAFAGTNLPPPTRTLHILNCVWLC